MRMNTTPIIEVTAFFETEDGFPVVPCVVEGVDQGYSLAVDVIEVQYIFNTSDSGVLMLSGRARGPRIDRFPAGPAFGEGMKWIYLDINAIPGQLKETVTAMTLQAVEEWRKTREAA